jgi:hypothetical protein
VNKGFRQLHHGQAAAGQRSADSRSASASR